MSALQQHSHVQDLNPHMQRAYRRLVSQGNQKLAIKKANARTQWRNGQVQPVHIPIGHGFKGQSQYRNHNNIAKSHIEFPYVSTSGHITNQSMRRRVNSTIDKMLRKSAGAFDTSDLANGGALLEAQSAYLFALIKDEPTVLNEARLVPLAAKQQTIDRITFASRIFHTATEGAALAEGKRSKPTMSKIQMNAQTFKAEIRLTYESLINNIMRLGKQGLAIRGSRFENMVICLAAEQAALDMEEFAMLSDSASADADLNKFEGWLKIAASNNAFSHGSNPVNKEFFKKTFLTIPKQYRSSRKIRLRWLMSPDLNVEWMDEMADRVTPFGDGLLAGNSGKQMMSAYRIPIIESSTMRTDLGAGSNEGQALCTDPRNLILGLHEQVYMDSDKDVGTSEAIFVLRFAVDAKMEQPEGSTLGEDVVVN